MVTQKFDMTQYTSWRSGCASHDLSWLFGRESCEYSFYRQSLFRFFCSSHPFPFSGVCLAQPTSILSQVIDAAKREELGGGPTDPTLITSTDVFVRVGLVDHFDLRIRAGSLAGGAIAQAFGVTPLLPKVAGEAKILEGLRNEQASQTEMTMEEVIKLARQLEREENGGGEWLPILFFPLRVL